jgi:hypothetical protein
LYAAIVVYISGWAYGEGGGETGATGDIGATGIATGGTCFWTQAFTPKKRNPMAIMKYSRNP